MASIRLTNLPSELLALVGAVVGADDGVFWFCILCRTFRACMSDYKHPTPISSMFVSVKRYNMALEYPRVRDILFIPDVACQGMFLWSSKGIIAMARFASIQILNYAMPQWIVDTATTPPPGPESFLKIISRYGRVDLLRHMDATADVLGIEWVYQFDTLHSILNRALTNSDTSMHVVAEGIVVPSLKCGNPSVFRWYIERQERAEADRLQDHSPTSWMGLNCSAFRTQFHSSYGLSGLSMLACAASVGDDPFFSLDFLCQEVWPAVGDRSPQRQHTAFVQIAGFVLMRLGGTTWPTMIGAWQWLKAKWNGDTGVVALLEALKEYPAHFSPQNLLVSSIFKVGTVDVYNWIVKEIQCGGWLASLWVSGSAHNSISESLAFRCGQSNRKLAFAACTLIRLHQRHLFLKPRSISKNEDALIVVALTDAILWSRMWMEVEQAVSVGEKKYTWSLLFTRHLLKFVDWVGEHRGSATPPINEVFAGVVRRRDELGELGDHVLDRLRRHSAYVPEVLRPDVSM